MCVVGGVCIRRIEFFRHRFPRAPQTTILMNEHFRLLFRLFHCDAILLKLFCFSHSIHSRTMREQKKPQPTRRLKNENILFCQLHRYASATLFREHWNCLHNHDTVAIRQNRFRYSQPAWLNQSWNGIVRGHPFNSIDRFKNMIFFSLSQRLHCVWLFWDSWLTKFGRAYRPTIDLSSIDRWMRMRRMHVPRRVQWKQMEIGAIGRVSHIPVTLDRVENDTSATADTRRETHRIARTTAQNKIENREKETKRWFCCAAKRSADESTHTRTKRMRNEARCRSRQRSEATRRRRRPAGKHAPNAKSIQSSAYWPSVKSEQFKASVHFDCTCGGKFNNTIQWWFSEIFHCVDRATDHLSVLNDAIRAKQKNLQFAREKLTFCKTNTKTFLLIE